MTLTCREWEKLPLGTEGLTKRDADRLYAAAIRANRRLQLPQQHVLTRTRDGLKAGQTVGILSVPGQTVEILPKIDGENGAVRKALIRMLAVSLGVRVAAGELSALDTQRRDLLELLARLFADRLLAAVRRGLPRRYIAHENDLPVLRGRLNVTRQVTHLAVRPDRLACRYDELSEDTPLNRVLKAAVTRLARLVRAPANIRSLAELAARFEAVSDSPHPLREAVRLDRTNTAFHDLHRMARLFLDDEWQSTTSGVANGFALLFPMHKLFEEFVGCCLKRALAPHPVHLQYGRQRRGKFVLADDRGGLFGTYPDAVAEMPKSKVVVLDTKWKELKPGEDRRKVGVEQGDVYQMLAYSRAWGATRLILLYPWRKETSDKGILRRWMVANSNCALDIATVDVGAPDRVVATLREIVDSPGP